MTNAPRPAEIPGRKTISLADRCRPEESPAAWLSAASYWRQPAIGRNGSCLIGDAATVQPLLSPRSCLRDQRCFQVVELLAGRLSGFQHCGEPAELVHYRRGRYAADRGRLEPGERSTGARARCLLGEHRPGLARGGSIGRYQGLPGWAPSVYVSGNCCVTFGWPSTGERTT